MNEKPNKWIFIPILAILFVMIGYQYICPAGGQACHFRTGDKLVRIGPPSTPDPTTDDPEEDSPTKCASKFNFTERDLTRDVDFNIKGDDVIVFLHIQKTGGTTFGRHLVRNIRLEQPCDCKAGQKKCTCHRPGKQESWLFSRFSTGWSCGLHADWTELTNCVPVIMDKRQPPKRKRKFYYITLLRDPVSRYLSEWRHVQRGATWKTSLHMCDGRTPTPEELPSCYEGSDWSGCTLQHFMDCPYNLANNRQVRMLADLSLVGCYNLSTVPEKRRSQLLLESAKKNLRDMAFFGLTEFQRKTQYLFERTFHLKFIRPFMQYNSTRAAGVDLDNDTIQRIEELNDLDMKLYDYAKDLFQQRYQYKHMLDRREQRLLRGQASFHSPFREDGAGGEGTARLPTEDYMNHIVNGW
ncbi:heparan-sulfate 6-O-sulfotransferase 1-B-like [Puntigrus tetrazona]|uniref:heparan-sulfate 6-O-sulfotransferase 1-B-like n=1 Tax=Puntigrus tetrazona TaxID=1606681 RepID=UPI001C8A2089|nr:heparan-sulfate 6-O-sulfotransferase 1-B-like [Puntigrus tetrazona]